VYGLPKILVVDDDHAVRSTLGKVSETAHFRVTSACNAGDTRPQCRKGGHLRFKLTFLWSRFGLVLFGSAAYALLWFPLQVRELVAFPADPAHGLRGYYYPSRPSESDAFFLPKSSIQNPYAIRVDPQIAFGKDKGFVLRDGHRQFRWWVPVTNEGHISVVWKGYIRLSKSGRYYISTVSHNGSAVYLNESRVALNGGWGAGALTSEDFTYSDAHAQLIPTFQPQQNSYLVPVEVDSPRVLPIEVRFSTYTMSSTIGYGIDLYWVTPDAPRDPSGKPLAQIVPSDVLYVDPPVPVERARVRGENSTITSEFLYVPASSEFALTIRLADSDGKAVSGKRVHVSEIVERGNRHPIVQPEKPTDERGIAVAKVRATGSSAEPQFYATDLTDFVDVSQVAQVTVQNLPPFSFLPLTYAPYYDDNKFLVEPLPLRMGQPVTVKVPLQNRSKFPAELRATFLASPANIGSPHWDEIGIVDKIKLEPEERREISIQWTPSREQGHLCFQVKVTGVFSLQTQGAWNIVPTAMAASSGQARESLQRNIGPVTRPSCELGKWVRTKSLLAPHGQIPGVEMPGVFACKCVWECVPCDGGPVLRSSSYEPPITSGRPTSSYSTDPQVEGECLCNKPGAEAGCNDKANPFSEYLRSRRSSDPLRAEEQ
jgi:hypothetical protein